MNQPAKVYIVGAGPGQPGLLTLRAMQCLENADVVLHDKLVPPELLRLIPKRVQLICVSDLCANHCDRYKPVRETIVRAARAGQRVVRLKGGDPFIFGRGGEEVEYLQEQGIHFEIVAGVTSGIGAAAYAGIPLTHRAHASAVAFVTGHENPEKAQTSVDWRLLANFPGTLVIYMGLSRLPIIVRSLLESGKAPATPAAVVHWGTTGRQRTVEAPLDALVESVQNAGIVSPAVIIIGSVVQLRKTMVWLERQPLFGKRILITRPRQQAEELAQRLDLMGAVTHILPVVEIEPLNDLDQVDRAIAALDSFDWLVFTSANGVRAFLDRLLEIGHDLRALGSIRIAAIGPKTAEILQSYHLIADLIPDTYRSEELAEKLLPVVAGKRVLLARADRGRDVLPKELAAVANVEQLTVYRQVDDVSLDAPELDLLRRGEIDFVTLTSSNIARSFMNCLDETCRRRIESGDVKLAAISPVTGDEIRNAGLPLAVEASVFTTEGLIAALVEENENR